MRNYAVEMIDLFKGTKQLAAARPVAYEQQCVKNTAVAAQLNPLGAIRPTAGRLNLKRPPTDTQSR